VSAVDGGDKLEYLIEEEGVALRGEGMWRELEVELGELKADGLVVGEVAGEDVGVCGLFGSSNGILVDVGVDEGPGFDEEEGVEGPFLVGVVKPFELVVVEVTEELGAEGDGMHLEGSGEEGYRLVGVFVEVKGVVGAVLDVSALAGGVDHGVVGDDHVVGGESELGEEVVEGVGVEPVIGIEDFDVLAVNAGKCGIDAGAVLGVGFVNDRDDVWEASLVVLSDVKGGVGRAVIDDNDLEVVCGECSDGIEAAREEVLHVVSRDDDREGVHGCKDKGYLELHKFTDLLRGVNKSVHICSQNGLWRRGEKWGEKEEKVVKNERGRAKKNFSSCTNSQICKGM
jgi:hypothetical protein